MKTRLRLLMLALAVGGASVGAVSATSGASAANTCSTKTPCPAPTVATANASSVAADAATLNGTVVPNGSATTCHFEYGTTVAFGMRTNAKTVTTKNNVSTTTPIPVSTRVTGLTPGTTFLYRMSCTNATGTAVAGNVVQFATSSDLGPSQIKLSGHTGFVSPSGTAGVFIGCYGSRNCTGSVRVLHNGNVIGSRPLYVIPANSGGIIHVSMATGAMNTLRKQGVLKVTIASTTTDGQTLQGGDTGLSLTLHLFR